MSTIRLALLLATGAMALAGCDQAKKAETTATGNEAAGAIDHKDPIASAAAAAPEAVARDAAIVAMNPDGTMKTLREGKNGWTCMPDNPATPGPDPMCGDANAMKWAEAWVGKKPPPANTVGFMYMLAGGTDASNTDPYAQAPTEGNAWIETGPHVMVVGSKEILTGYPSGAKPDTKVPYVMWAGTPYAHMMIPVGDGS